MKHRSLVQIRDFYTRMQVDGEAATNAYKAAFGVKSASSSDIQKIVTSDEYNMIAAAVDKVVAENLQREIRRTQAKKIRMYSSLLDRGQDLIESAETHDEKIAAQENQRKNLQVDFIDVFADNRNQQDYGDALDGIIIE